jgi:transcriptional regulator with XRE-family HTH domain
MKDRLSKIITSEGLNPALLAKEIGIQRATVSHVLNGRNNPGFDFIHNLLMRFPKLNAEWLITGQGPMYKSSTVDGVGKHDSDLFSSPVHVPVEKKQDSPTLPEKQKDLPPVEDRKKTVPDKQQVILPVADIAVTEPQKTIEKIVFFYADKTFATYHPEG